MHLRMLVQNESTVRSSALYANELTIQCLSQQRASTLLHMHLPGTRYPVPFLSIQLEFFLSTSRGVFMVSLYINKQSRTRELVQRGYFRMEQCVWHLICVRILTLLNELLMPSRAHPVGRATRATLMTVHLLRGLMRNVSRPILFIFGAPLLVRRDVTEKKGTPAPLVGYGCFCFGSSIRGCGTVAREKVANIFTERIRTRALC